MSNELQKYYTNTKHCESPDCRASCDAIYLAYETDAHIADLKRQHANRERESNDRIIRLDDQLQLLRQEHAEEISAKDAEISRLTECLKKANANHEHFERNWYLRGNEIEALNEKHVEALARLAGDQLARDADMYNLAEEAKHFRDIKSLVSAQADDHGLWFCAQTAAEAYLQQELRKLHAAIEVTP